MAPRRQKPGAQRRLPIVVAALVLIGLGGSYYLCVRARTAYLISRETRLLSSAAAQLNQTLSSKRLLLRNFAVADTWCDGGNPITEYRPGGDNGWLREYLGDLDYVARDAPTKTISPLLFKTQDLADRTSRVEQYRQRLVRQNDQVFLEIEYLGPYPEGKAPKRTERKAAKRTECGIGAVRPHAFARLSFERIAAPIFNRGVLAGFDDILLVRGDGTVLYQIQPDEGNGGSGLGRIVASEAARSATAVAPNLIVTNLSSLRMKTGFRADGPLPISSVRGQTQRAEVTLAGSDYILMSQPYRDDTASSDLIAAASDPADPPPARGDDKLAQPVPPKESGDRHLNEWIIAGLASKTRFLREATAVSASLVALFTGLLILLVCGAPFLKLALLGEYHPVTRADVALLVLATLLGAGIATLIVADYITYKRVKNIADYQQRAFAASMQTALRSGVNNMVHVADELQRWSFTYAVGQKQHTLPRESIGRVGTDHPELRDRQQYPWVNLYPWFSSFAWVDTAGKQHFRAAMREGPPPLLSVEQRAYFQQVTTRPWSWHDEEGAVHPIYIESVRTMTTGRPETVFAIPTVSDRWPVFSITFPFVQFAGPVTPPGLTFAVIDRQGAVLYHSDPQRIGVENVFVETDNSRRLRAAVYARHEELVDAPYWGEDQRILVTPLQDVPWTLLTFRQKRLLRTVNLEALVITIALLLLYLALWAVAFLAVGASRPRYRASWLWPDAARGPSFRRLRWMFVCTAAIFVVSLYYFDAPMRLAISFIIPPQVVVSSYLILRQGPRRSGYAIVAVIWLALTAWLVAALIRGPIDGEVLLFHREWPIRALTLAIAAIAAYLTLRDGTGGDPVPWREYARSYVTSGVLAIVLVAALPTVGFFQTAHRIEMESLLRYGQLVIAERLEARLDQLATTAWTNDPQDFIARWYYIPAFFQSVWCFQPNQLPTEAPCGAASTVPKAFQPSGSGAWKHAKNRVAETIEEFLPQYSDDSASMRDLHHWRAVDGAWRWLRQQRAVALVRRLQVAEAAAPKLFYRVEPRDMATVIISRMPRLLPNWLLPADSIGEFPEPTMRGHEAIPHLDLPQPLREQATLLGIRRLSLVLLALALAGAMVAVVRFISRKIFVCDVHPPEWLNTSGPLKGSLGDHIFFVRGTRAPCDLIEPADYAAIRFADLAASDGWDATLDAIDRSETQRNLLFEDFELGFRDAGVTRLKLLFLERLLQIPDRTIVIASTVSLPLLLATASASRRWAALLASFVVIEERRLPPADVRRSPAPIPPPRETQKQLPEAPLYARVWSKAYWQATRLWGIQAAQWVLDRLGLRPQRVTNESWIADEGARDLFLAKLGKDVLRSGIPREQLIDEFCERTAGYYLALWTSCSAGERMMLYQLARYGFVNGNNRRLLRRLMARHLVYRDGDVRLLNETFRRFVLSREADVLRDTEELAEGESAWNRLRVPILIVLVAVVALFLVSQKELINSTSTIITGLAAGLPALMKLVGVFTDRRVTAAAATE